MTDDLAPLRRGDADDERLLAVLRPEDHAPPTPRPRYDLVVIGGGPAGLVAAHGAAGLGARVAIVEAGLLGGDCLNTGCVPSKSLIAASSGRIEGRSDGRGALAHARRVRADIAPHDGVARLTAAGIDVFLGHARFVSRDAVVVGDAVLRFAHAVIATGSRPSRPGIPGLDDPDVLDTNSLWALEDVPERVAILGAGAVGAELSQALARLGSEVVLVDMAPRALPQADPEASAVVASALERVGVRLRLGAGVQRVQRAGHAWTISIGSGDEIVVDRVIVAMGRAPRVEDLDLDRAGIAASPRGIVVDDRLRTANPAIFAIGDVAGGGFTHVADAMARVAVQNALVAPTARWSGDGLASAVYTSPELAHVGPSYAVLSRRRDVEAVTVPFADLDRGRADGVVEGFLKAWVDRRGRLVAATIVGEGAGDLIATGVLALQQGLKAEALSALVLPYPTRGEAWKRVGDAMRRRKLTPAIAGLLRRWIRWRGAGR